MTLTIRDCIEIVAEANGIAPATLLNQSRWRPIARARQVAMWLSRQSTQRSLSEIGMVFHRDHTTVLHGIRTVEKLRVRDKDLNGLMITVQARATMRSAGY